MVSPSRKRRVRGFSFYYTSFETLEPRQLLAAASVASIPGFHPNDIAQAYGFNKLLGPRGRGQTIAISSAFHSPTIEHDLKVFDRTFGLPAPPSFEVVTEDTSASPAQDAGWAVETAIDVELIHAMAPYAKIVLFEAKTNNFLDLFKGMLDASRTPGVSVVSMSWGGLEFSNESFFDPLFTAAPNVTFVVSSGDSGEPPSFPATTPYVVAVGGTRLGLDAQGKVQYETPWTNAGGGISEFYARPGYQAGIGIPGTGRATADIAFDADPATGYSIYTTTVETGGTPGWQVLGGTSASAPVAAAMFGIVNQFRSLLGKGPIGLATDDLYAIYGSKKLYASAFRDIKTGGIVNHGSGPATINATKGYDLASGLGVPIVNVLVPLLAQAPGPSVTAAVAAARVTSLTVSAGMASPFAAVHEAVGIVLTQPADSSASAVVVERQVAGAPRQAETQRSLKGARPSIVDLWHLTTRGAAGRGTKAVTDTTAVDSVLAECVWGDQPLAIL